MTVLLANIIYITRVIKIIFYIMHKNNKNLILGFIIINIIKLS